MQPLPDGREMDFLLVMQHLMQPLPDAREMGLLSLILRLMEPLPDGREIGLLSVILRLIGPDIMEFGPGGRKLKRKNIDIFFLPIKTCNKSCILDKSKKKIST